jgi:hypothetical protein
MVNHKIWNGTEKSAVSFPLAYQRMRHSVAVVILLGATGVWNPPQDSTVLAVYDGL